MFQTFTAAVNECDNEGTQFREEVDVCESNSESFQLFQLTAFYYQSAGASQPSASGTNETYDKTQNKKITALQPNSKLQRELQQLQNSLPDVTGSIDAIKIPSAASKKCKGQPFISSVNSEKELLDLETKNLSVLLRKFDEDKGMNFSKSLIPHVKQLPSLLCCISEAKLKIYWQMSCLRYSVVYFCLLHLLNVNKVLFLPRQLCLCPHQQFPTLQVTLLFLASIMMHEVILHKILGSHGSEYEGGCLLGCSTM
jgi:hypothetical protein